MPSPLYIRETGRYEHDGMIWKGRAAMQASDLTALMDELGPDVKVDKLSIVGRDDPAYSTFRKANRKKFTLIFWR
jgi:hypothetical protein